MRSLGGWQAARTLQRGRERWAFDERILGRSEFVQEVLAERRSHTVESASAEANSLSDLLAYVALPPTMSNRFNESWVLSAMSDPGRRGLCVLAIRRQIRS